MKFKSFLLKFNALFIAFVIAISGVIVPAYGETDNKAVNYQSKMEWPSYPEVVAEGAYLVELKTGAVVFGKSSNEQFYPASITKVLTALVVLEHSSLDEMCTFSHNAVYNIEEGGFSYIAEEGDQLSVEDLLYAMLLHSSNEAAVCLAEHVAGSVEEFAKLMNERAKKAGATNSNFANPNGLTNSSHVTTPHDMAMILWAAVQNPTFVEIDSHVTHRTAPTKSNPEGFYCLMRHMMMKNTEFKDERVVCGKTGYISAAGNTLVTYAKDEDKEFVCVVMKDQGTNNAYKDTKKLLNYGFDTFDIKQIPSNVTDEDIIPVVEDKTRRTVESISFDKNVNLLLPRDADAPEITGAFIFGDDETDITIEDTVNECSGDIVYYMDDKEIASCKVDIKLKPVPQTLVENIEELLSPSSGNSVIKVIFIVVLCIILLAVIGYVILMIYNKFYKKKRRRGSRKRR